MPRGGQRRGAGHRLRNAADRRRGGGFRRRPEGDRRGPLRRRPRRWWRVSAIPLLSRYVDWSILRVGAQDRCRLRLDLALPARQSRLARAGGAAPPGRGSHRRRRRRPPRSLRYFTAFPPLTSAGHMQPPGGGPGGEPQRRAEVRQRQLAARDVPRRRRERLPQSLRPAPDRPGPHRPLRPHPARGPRCRWRASSCPSCRPTTSRWPTRGWRWRRRAADAPTVLRGVPAARLDEPAIRLERAQWLRRTGNLNDAKALLTAPAVRQNEAWGNERQPARARPAGRRPRQADAYAVAAAHGLTRGVAFAEAEFLAGWIALRHLKRTADAQKHFQTLYDGVTTDISKSRAAYWLGRTHEAAGRAKEAKEWYGASRRIRPDLLRPARRAQAAGRRRRACRPIPSHRPTDQQSLGGRELVTMARYLGQAGDFERTRPFLLRLARMVHDAGRDGAAGPARRRAQAPRRGAHHRAAGDPERRHPVRHGLSRRRSRRHRIDRAGAGARGVAPGERLQRRRRLARRARSA